MTSVITEDDGDNDETNDGATTTTSTTTSTTTTTTTTTAKPKAFRNRFRGNRPGEDEYKKYAISATSVVSLKDAEEYRNSKPHQHQRRRNTVEVECQLRVPGDGAGNGHWKANRTADLYYSVRKSVAYKYHNDLPPPGDAFAAVSSASSVADDDDNDADTYGNGSDRGADSNDAPKAQNADDDAISGATSVTASFSTVVVRSVQTIAAAAVATAAARR